MSFMNLLSPPLAAPPAQSRQDVARAARTPDYNLPEVSYDLFSQQFVPPHPMPTLDQVVAWKNERIGYHADRNNRMLADERLYLMTNAPERKRAGKGGEEVIISNYLRSLVDKMSYKIARNKRKIQCVPRAQTPEYVQAARDIEYFLYDLRETADSKHEAHGKPDLAYTEAWYAALRGWLVSRVYLDAGDTEAPICIDLFDPVNCYPRFGRVGIGYLRDMIYYEEADTALFLACYPQYAQHRYFLNRRDQSSLKWLYFEDDWYSALVVDDSVVLDVYEHAYGYCPWAVDLAAGPPSNTTDARSQKGSGVAAAIRHIYLYSNRFYSQVASDIARMANPAKLVMHNGAGAPVAIDTTPGGVTELDSSKGQDMRFLEIMTRPEFVQAMNSWVERELARGAMPDQVWGDPSGLTNGFHQTVAIEAMRDAMFPVAEAIESHGEKQNRLALAALLVAERKGVLMPVQMQGQMPSQGVVYQRPGAYNQGPVYSTLMPEAVHKHGLGSEVHLRRMNPTDQLQVLQAANVGVQSGLFSLRYAREELLDIDDSTAMNNEVMFDQLFKDPEILKRIFLPEVIAQLKPQALGQFLALTQAQPQPQGQMQSPGGLQQPATPQPGPEQYPNAQLPAQMQAGSAVPGAGDPAAIIAQLLGEMQPPNAQNMPPVQ
jgi:hypothetical protein